MKFWIQYETNRFSNPKTDCYLYADKDKCYNVAISHNTYLFANENIISHIQEIKIEENELSALIFNTHSYSERCACLLSLIKSNPNILGEKIDIPLVERIELK